MKKIKKGFTLIELLVVIVIIGILATIGVATFQGYFEKARDLKRLTAVQNIAKIIKAHLTFQEDSSDYRFGGSNSTIKSDIIAILNEQGYSIPDSEQGIDYYYLMNTTRFYTPDSFAVFTCKESSIGRINGNDSEIGFKAGAGSLISNPNGANESMLNVGCGAPSPFITLPIITGHTFINLSN